MPIARCRADFELLVAGHVSRPGTRQDVITQMELLKDLGTAAKCSYERNREFLH